MHLEKELRKLAKSTYWQNLYHGSKDLCNINLFYNASDFSGIQVSFLYWLRAYNSIYENLSNQDFDFLNEEMIKDDIRVDAFLFWRQKHYDAERRNSKEEDTAKKLDKNTKPGKKSYCQVDYRSE